MILDPIIAEKDAPLATEPRRRKYRNDLTAEYLRSILSYDAESGLFTWLVTRNSVAVTGASAGCWWKRPRDTGGMYLVIRIDGVLYRANRLAWLWVTGEWPEEAVDHKDLDSTNNKWANLRAATGTQNQANGPIQKNNKSGQKGVYWHKGAKKWIARIVVRGRTHHLGCFDHLNDAAAAYATAAAEHFGEFARP